MQELWEGYKQTYAKLEPMRQNLSVYMQERSAAHKRKLAELQSEGERLMNDAERQASDLCPVPLHSASVLYMGCQ